MVWAGIYPERLHVGAVRLNIARTQKGHGYWEGSNCGTTLRRLLMALDKTC
jgi:hypothetical protein